MDDWIRASGDIAEATTSSQSSIGLYALFAAALMHSGWVGECLVLSERRWLCCVSDSSRVVIRPCRSLRAQSRCSLSLCSPYFLLYALSVCLLLLCQPFFLLVVQRVVLCCCNIS